MVFDGVLLGARFAGLAPLVNILLCMSGEYVRLVVQLQGQKSGLGARRYSLLSFLLSKLGPRIVWNVALRTDLLTHISSPSVEVGQTHCCTLPDRPPQGTADACH